VESLLILVAVFLVIALVVYLRGQQDRQAPPNPPRNGAAPRSPKQPATTYRPRASKKATRQGVRFKPRVVSSSSVGDLDISDLVDALTGAPLVLGSGLYQCENCRVFYQSHSVEVIRAENRGQCVSCLRSTIVPVTARREHQRGRNADVAVITLNNYQQHVGHVITFEDQVHTVLTSRRGSDYAVMFENKSWTRGFKMVVFRGAVKDIGGPQTLFNMVGRKVRVRGLLIQHQRFGYEIVISDRTQILNIQ